MSRRFSLFVGIAIALYSFNVRASVADPIRSIGISLSNYLAALESEGSADRKLVSAVKKSVAAANRASDTDIGVNVKIVGQIATAMLRSSASNDFVASVDGVLDTYILALASGAESSSNLLRNAFSSGPRTAAERNLVQLFNYLVGAESNADLIAAAKLLSKAAVKAKVVDKLVSKALLVPPPPAHVTGNVTIQGAPAVGAIAFKSRAAVITPGAPGYFGILSGQTAGTELRTVAFALSGISAGANDVAIDDGSFAFASLKRHGVFVDGVGSAQVNWNPETGTLVGTFTYNMTEQDGTRTATITGSFSGTY